MPYLLPFTLSYSVILAIAYECAMSARASTRSTFSKFLHISHSVCKFSSRQYQSLSFSLSSYLSHCSFNVIFWFLFILYFYYTYFYCPVMWAGAGAATGEVKAFAQHLKSVNRMGVGEEKRKKERGVVHCGQFYARAITVKCQTMCTKYLGLYTLRLL